MGILHLISNNNFIVTHKFLIKRFGLYEANIIGLFASISNFNEIENPNMNGWFYATYDKIEDELNLTEDKAAKPIKNLVNAGILMIKKEGIPCRKYFKFNEEKLQEALIFNASSRTPKNGGQEAGKTENKNSKNSGSSEGKNGLKDPEKTGGNNNIGNDNTSSSSLPTIEEAKKFAEEEDLKIDVEKWFKFSKDEKIRNWKKAIRAWAENPKNLFVRKNQTTETKEIQNIRYQIKRLMPTQNEYDMNFAGCDIKKAGDSFVIYADKTALKYEKMLKEINVKIEVKNV